MKWQEVFVLTYFYLLFSCCCALRGVGVFLPTLCWMLVGLCAHTGILQLGDIIHGIAFSL